MLVSLRLRARCSSSNVSQPVPLPWSETLRNRASGLLDVEYQCITVILRRRLKSASAVQQAAISPLNKWTWIIDRRRSSCVPPDALEVKSTAYLENIWALYIRPRPRFVHARSDRPTLLEDASSWGAMCGRMTCSIAYTGLSCAVIAGVH